MKWVCGWSGFCENSVKWGVDGCGMNEVWSGWSVE